MKPKYLLLDTGKVTRSFAKAVECALASSETTVIQEWVGNKIRGEFRDIAYREGDKFVLAYHLLGQLPSD